MALGAGQQRSALQAADQAFTCMTMCRALSRCICAQAGCQVGAAGFLPGGVLLLLGPHTWASDTSFKAMANCCWFRLGLPPDAISHICEQTVASSQRPSSLLLVSGASGLLKVRYCCHLASKRSSPCLEWAAAGPTW